jgi:hypothetical protein
MKKVHLLPWLSGIAILNMMLPHTLSSVAESTSFRWHEMLGGEALPNLTKFAFRMPVFFYVFTALSLAEFIAIFVPKADLKWFVHVGLAAGFVELASLLLFVVGVTWPTGCILYRVAPNTKASGECCPLCLSHVTRALCW